MVIIVLRAVKNKSTNYKRNILYVQEILTRIINLVTKQNGLILYLIKTYQLRVILMMPSLAWYWIR